MQSTVRRIFAALVAGIGLLALAPGAVATVTPTVSLDQSGGTTAGSTVPLGMDLKFAPTGTDSPKDLTLSLPPGLLASASIGGGACLRATGPLAKCKVGTGTVTAAPLSSFPTPLPLTFYLVAPPKHGDLAGLLVEATILGSQSQLGSPGEVSLRTGSDPRGIGLNIAFRDLPNTFSGIPVTVRELSSTFSALRLPTSCPATPVSLHVSVDSYADTTQRGADAPLHVTGCSKLPYSATFRLTAIKDAHDNGTQVTTEVSQPAKPPQATNRTVTLTLPPQSLPPNFAVITGGILCADPASGTCTPIGSATSTSPTYPTPLHGKVYLTGTTSGGLPQNLGIAIQFPAPFALTIQGTVDVATNSTTFHGIPDIPLTDLLVTLNGGPKSAFIANCSHPSGTATSTLTSQNGDRTITVQAPFSVSGCGATSTPRAARIGWASLSGLAKGRPTLRFKLVAGSSKLTSFTVQLPRGLSFLALRGRVRGVSLTGARAASIVLSHGRLVVKLRHPANSVSVKIGPRALIESGSLRARAIHHRVPKLKLRVTIKNLGGKRTTAVHVIRVRS